MRHLALAFFLFAAPPDLPAQGGEGLQEPGLPPLQRVDPADPGTTPAELRIVLAPLTKGELEALTANWLVHVHGKAEEIADWKVTRLRSEGTAAEAAANRVLQLTEEQTTLVDRFRLVLSAFTAKGGDAGEYETYIASLPGLDVGNIGALWGALMRWASSEEGGVRWGLNLLKALVTLLVFRILSRVLGRIVGRALRAFQQTSDLLRNFFVNTVHKVTSFIGIVIALSFLEVPTGPFLAAIGAAGFVVGFALQGTLSNFASGVMILLYRPYDIGDAVVVGGITGKVQAMTLVSTTLIQPDNQVAIVPNSKIWGGVITNITGSP